MKKIILLTAMILNPAYVFASSVDECNKAINKAAAYLRVQASMSEATNRKTSLSQSDRIAMINTSKVIISEGKRIIALCRLNREMTEGILDVIIKNTERVEKSAYRQTQNIKSADSRR